MHCKRNNGCARTSFCAAVWKTLHLVPGVFVRCRQVVGGGWSPAGVDGVDSLDNYHNTTTTRNYIIRRRSTG